MTLALCVVATGLAAGLTLAVMRTGAPAPMRWAIVGVVDALRALPPLVLIVLLYLGLPAAGLALSGFAAAWLALSLVLMAFAEELF